MAFSNELLPTVSIAAHKGPLASLFLRIGVRLEWVCLRAFLNESSGCLSRQTLSGIRKRDKSESDAHPWVV